MSFNTALSGLKAASSNLGVIGNNIANASTNGFKRSRTEFADVYAASSLGSGGQAIGSGVFLKDVAQQFDQGTVTFTQSNLDLAMNGPGFFIVSSNGAIAYTRSGAFGLDRDGYIANSEGQRLRGFLADNTGSITGAQGDLHISRANVAPLATNLMDIQLNLDATTRPPSTPFVSGFTPDSPPIASSYTSTTATTIYDSLGNPHVMTAYFVKTAQPNQWNVHVGVDGTDVTPTAAAVPGGTPPQPYTPGDVATPFTLVFSDTGTFIPNNPAVPPQFYGATPALNLAGTLVNSNALPVIQSGNLTINGIQIESSFGSTDVFSTTDNAGSAIALAAAINSSSDFHGVTATPVGAVVDLGTFTLGDLAAGDLTINGQPIINGSVASINDVRDSINLLTSLTGVTASVSMGSLLLTATDGRNIQVETAGSSSDGATFSNFTMTGAALDKVQRGQLSLNTVNNSAIVIGGDAPGNAGLGTGPLAGILYSNSDAIELTGWNPGSGATAPQDFMIDLSSSSQYGAPFSVQALSQNGYSTGRFTSVDVDTTGVIIARYSNGQSLQLGQVALANFADPQGLQPLGKSSWQETFSSGSALIGLPGSSNMGLIQSGALEDSNVELTDELVALITAQRDFQANAQTIRTNDAITQTIINLR